MIRTKIQDGRDGNTVASVITILAEFAQSQGRPLHKDLFVTIALTESRDHAQTT
jgi:hypothetical protein